MMDYIFSLIKSVYEFAAGFRFNGNVGGCSGPAINHVNLLIAATLLLTNSWPMDENIFKLAVTIVMRRRIDNMPTIKDTIEKYV